MGVAAAGAQLGLAWDRIKAVGLPSPSKTTPVKSAPAAADPAAVGSPGADAAAGGGGGEGAAPPPAAEQAEYGRIILARLNKLAPGAAAAIAAAAAKLPPLPTISIDLGKNKQEIARLQEELKDTQQTLTGQLNGTELALLNKLETALKGQIQLRQDLATKVPPPPCCVYMCSLCFTVTLTVSSPSPACGPCRLWKEAEVQKADESVARLKSEAAAAAGMAEQTQAQAQQQLMQYGQYVQQLQQALQQAQTEGQQVRHPSNDARVTHGSRADTANALPSHLAIDFLSPRRPRRGRSSWKAKKRRRRRRRRRRKARWRS
jgi:hypothetical protein